MHSTGHLIEKARRFAAALDARDYSAVAEFLTSDCRYHVSNEDIRVGPEAILASYDQSDARARRNFDKVKYSSEATADESGGIRLTFVDELHSGGATHTYSCAQIAYFDEQELIHEIKLKEFPGERVRLRQFCASHGIKLD